MFYSKHQYKEGVGGGTSISETPEMERVKRNQQNISTVLHCSEPLVSDLHPFIPPPQTVP